MTLAAAEYMISSNDFLAHVIADLIPSPAKFSLQLDEIVNIFSLNQILVFTCYVSDDMIKEFFLFYKPLRKTTKAAGIKKFVDGFFRDQRLSWNIVSSVCLDTGMTPWFWNATEIWCNTHCYYTQARISNKNFASMC